MDSKTGIPIKKTKRSNREVKINFKKVFIALSKSAISLSVGNPISAFKELFSLIQAFKFSSDDTSNLAYRLILTALMNSAHNLAEENRNNFAEESYDATKHMTFLNGITAIIEDREMIIEYEMLRNPRLIPILDTFKKYFAEYLVLFGISERDAELIKNRLPSYFVFELNNEWSKNSTEYKPLIEELHTPISEAERRERQWETYYAYLEREIPVFGESFSLNKIFIPPRAYYKKRRGSEIDKMVVWLDKSMDNWLASSEYAIKVIQGGPSSGKSSFVKWWTAKIAHSRSHSILFFPLHHFNKYTDISTAIGNYLKDSQNVPLDFNPLDDTSIFDKLILVFDGLDELVMEDKSPKEVAMSFVQELDDFCRLKNEGKQRVKILITGRPIAIQNTEQKLRKNEMQIMYLLPYFVNNLDRFNYIDDEKILIKDQRNQWWNKFYVLKNLPHSNLPPELSGSNMDKITSEPLLNYLVALIWKDSPEKFNNQNNINAIYHQLILGVYNRDWESRKYRGIGDLTFDNFIQILGEIAICAWQGGDSRITTEKKIEKHIRDKGLEGLLEEYEASVKGGLSRLLTAFYFRKHGKETTKRKDDTFEFTHKSFGEYLAARAIVELIKLTNSNRVLYKTTTTSSEEGRQGWTIQQCLGEWLRVTGKNTLDSDINDFIFNEIQIRKDAGEDIKEWQESLCEVISELIYTGMPLDTLTQRSSQIEEMELARNAEAALLITLSNCAKTTESLSNIKWGEKNIAGAWFNRLSASIQPGDFVFKNLNNLDLNQVNLDGANLIFSHFNGSSLKEISMAESYLIKTNLYKVDFQKANLKKADLREADLKEANLTEADLREANLTGADLTAIDLTKTELIRTNLSGAILQDTILTEVDLTGADLTSADLTSANLRDANLVGANLTRANLEGADLRGTDLTGAYLNGVDFTGVDFTGNNLAGIDLKGAQLTNAYLIEATLIGNDLTKADLIGADLTKADLTGANLRGATLIDADLTNADFINVDFKEADLTGADLTGANLAKANLNLNQLLSTKSLWKTKHIPPELLDQIKKESPHLLKPPD